MPRASEKTATSVNNGDLYSERIAYLNAAAKLMRTPGRRFIALVRYEDTRCSGNLQMIKFLVRTAMAAFGSLAVCGYAANAQTGPVGSGPTVLHAARLLDVEGGRVVAPGEVLVENDRIVEAGASVTHPAGAKTIDLGNRTLMPGLIDVHVHLFLHPGAEDLQTVEESVPQRTILATLAARDDLMAGFTAERDMGTEGAGSADTAVRNA